MTDPVAFLVASVVLLAAPGPTNTLLFAAAFEGGIGRWPSLLSAALSGYSISILALASLSGVLDVLPYSAALLRLACVAYLAYTAFSMWRLIASGTPEEIAACKASHTGKALAALL